MKSMMKAFGAVALSGAVVIPALAGTDTETPKDLKKVLQDQGINYVETAQKGITLSGYVDTSYTYQFAGAGQYGPAATNAGGGPGNTQAALRQFDTSNNTFNVNAVKIALEKALPDKNEWAAGFRIDTIYGSDAKYLNDTAFTSSSTNNSGFALEQALVKFRIPVGNGLDIYMGKFVTFLGYEVIESPANPNFSRGLLFTNAIPLTTTGVYADYKFNDIVEAKLGIVDGWNNSTSSSVNANSSSKLGTFGTQTIGTSNDESSFGKAITGQINITNPGKNANICQSFIYSPEGEPGVVGVDNSTVVVYDIWGNWNPTFVKDSALTLGFNVDLGYAGGGTPYNPTGIPGGIGGSTNGLPDSTTWWGVALYSQYKFNKVVSIAGRAEYLHEDPSANPKFNPDTAAVNPNTGGLLSAGNQDDFSFTATLSFNIWDNLLTRVEYRYDHIYAGSEGGAGGVGSSYEADQNEISLNAVYSF